MHLAQCCSIIDWRKCEGKFMGQVKNRRKEKGLHKIRLLLSELMKGIEG